MATTTTIALGLSTIKRICESFGLDPSLTRRIIIDIPAGGVVMVHAEMLATSESLNVISAIAEEARIVGTDD